MAEQTQQRVFDLCHAENVSPAKRKRTGKACAVAECMGKNSDGISIHSFPTDPSLRRQWVQFVRVCRADFTSPTRHSVVCERHFAPECYPVTYNLMRQEGFEVKHKYLIQGSVPTIQKHAFSTPQFQLRTLTSSLSTALSQSATTVTCTSTTLTTTTASIQSPLASLSQLPGVIKERGAYVKREHQRVSKPCTYKFKC